jgi:hypothetical protein
MRGRWRVWCSLTVIAAGLTVAVAVLVVVTNNARSEQLTLRMRPALPLKMTGCIAEATPHGYSPVGAAAICALGKGRSWYRAVLNNSGDDAYPLCNAKAFDSRGNVVFSGQLVFDYGGLPAGFHALGHRSVSFSWYLPNVSRPVARYLATCSVNGNPPI